MKIVGFFQTYIDVLAIHLCSNITILIKIDYP
nr:MAG TPA: hypothetical protein [Caudoviricetes sp.]